jgi:hypothetical protein
MNTAPPAQSKLDVWEALREETRHAANVAESVAEAVGSSSPEHAKVDTRGAWQAAAKNTGVAIELLSPDDLPGVATAGAMLQKACQVVLSTLSKAAGDDARLAVTGEPLENVRGGAGVRWRLAHAGSLAGELREAFLGQPSESAPSLLSAYFLLYHLGGRVRLDGQGGVSVELPLNRAGVRVEPPDEDWAEMLFEGLEAPLVSKREPQ